MLVPVHRMPSNSDTVPEGPPLSGWSSIASGACGQLTEVIVIESAVVLEVADSAQ